MQLSHDPHDAPIAAWVADVLARTLPPQWTVEAAAVPMPPSSGSVSSLILQLSWRHRLARSIHHIRADDGHTLEQMHELSLRRLRAALEAPSAAPSESTRVLFVDDLVADFTPTLRRTLTSVLGGAAPRATDPAFLTVDTGSMTTEAMILLDAYATQAAAATSASTADAARAAAIAPLAASMPIEDLYTIVAALLGKRRASQPPALSALLAPLASNRSAPHSSRRARKRTLLELLVTHWRPPPSAAATHPRNRHSRGNDGVPSAARVVASHARAVGAVGAPLCELVPNLPRLCASLVATEHESAFGELFDAGCRCPSISPWATAAPSMLLAAADDAPPAAPPPPIALFVGTHHKTGTVLLEQLMQEATKSIDGARFYKPRWADCKPPTRRPHSSAESTTKLPSPSATILSLASLGVPHTHPPRLSAFCVDEHVKSLPLAARAAGSGELGSHHAVASVVAAMQRSGGSQSATARTSSSSALAAAATAAHAPFVHVIRDPVEVCASSYLYALRSNESWLRLPNPSLPEGMAYQTYYRRAPLREGLAYECKRCVKELRQMASLYEATRTDARSLTLRFEELVESGPSAFDASVRRMLLFAGLGARAGDVRDAARFGRLMSAMRKHDLSRRTVLGTRTSGHVSNASQKGVLRELLLRDPAMGLTTELQRLRDRLHYGASDEAQGVRRRRWRVAAVVN